MSKFDEIINNIDGKKRNPTKEELSQLIRESLAEINSLHDKYVEFFEGTDDKKAILKEIEDKLTAAQVAFTKLFPSGVNDTSVIDAISTRIQEIKDYHDELLDSDKSIQADIKDSQDKITAFYVELFGNKEVNGLKTAIVDFHALLTKAGGIEETVNQAYDEINAKHKELFVAPKGKTTSKIDDLEQNITRLDEYVKDFEGYVSPDVKKRQKEIENISKDIQVKQKEVGALLSGATANTLTEAYSDSKYEYSSRKPRAEAKNISSKVSRFCYNNVGRHGVAILNYILFITPLVGILFIFSSPLAAKIIANNFDATGMSASPLEILYSKTIVSLPLLWVAWFGQRNISQRKRLFEEYNHKLRVVQMYILFTTNETYKLNTARREELDTILLKTIGSNPSEHLGKGETYMDRVNSLVGRPKADKVTKHD